jgi:hypothetical protein
MRFEYRTVTWDPKSDGDLLADALNVLGEEEWEAVGFAPRGAAVPMAGMGAKAVPEMVVLLKRAKR